MNINPQIKSISEERDIYKFTLYDINLSIANGIRRTILNDIPTVVFDQQNIQIEVNTGRLHNELIKHRLECIPIYSKDLQQLPDNYILEIDVANDTDATIYVTTDDFKIRNKTNGNMVSESEVTKIFPKDPMTQDPILFARLRPKIGDTVPGERIKLTAEFSINTAGSQSTWNVVSKCSYGNTPDTNKIQTVWETMESKLLSEETTRAEVDFQKKNYILLDAQRQYIENSYDFVIQTLGVFDNKEIVKKACQILQNKFVKLIEQVDSNVVFIKTSETTMENSYDIVLENEDYTIGKIIEYFLYECYYVGKEEFLLNFCGFKKMHPHDSDSIIRIAYLQNADVNTVRQNLRVACVYAQEVFVKIYKMF